MRDEPAHNQSARGGEREGEGEPKSKRAGDRRISSQPKRERGARGQQAKSGSVSYLESHMSTRKERHLSQRVLSEPGKATR